MLRKPNQVAKKEVTITPTTAVATVPKLDSAICETAVAGALTAGLHPALAPAAYRACIKLLPSVRSLGFSSAKAAAQYLESKIAAMKFGKKGQTGKTSTTVSRAPLGGAGLPRTSAPVAVSRQVRRVSKPKMRIVGDSVVISHSEMVNSILSGTPTSNVTAYACSGFRANPGVASIFPWLSTIAVNYEKYKFRKLTFTIVPLVATNFSGRIGVGFDYDSSDPVPGTRQEFYALTTHAENMPWEAASITVKCDNVFRFTGTHSAADSKLIDQGQVLVMSDSISNGGSIVTNIALYDLLVDYEVELIEPQQSLFSSQSFNRISSFTVGAVLGTGADLTDVAGTFTANSVTVATASQLQIALPAGSYTILCHSNWTAGAATATATSSAGTLKMNTTVGTSFVVAYGVVTSPVDTVIALNLGTVAWNANLNKFNLVVTRVSSRVVTNFTP